MKKLGIILIILVVLVVGVVVGLQVYLKHGLNNTLQEQVIPVAKEALGVDVEIGHASVNLLGGSLSVEKTRLGNPEGFSESSIVSAENVGLDVAMMSLFGGVVDVAGANVDDLQLTVVRNAGGRINAHELQKTIESKSGKTGEEPPPEVPKTEEPAAEAVAAELPKVRVQQASVDTLARYIDHGLGEEPFSLALKTVVSVNGVQTFDDGSEWGAVSVTGHLVDNPEAFVMVLKGRVAPVTDPAKPSFDLEGEVVDFDLAALSDILEKSEITGSGMNLAITMKCRESRFEEGSQIALVVKNPQLKGALAEKVKGFQLPETLTIPVPLGGTLTDPDFHFLKGLRDTVVTLAKTEVPKQAIKKALESEKVKEVKGKVTEKVGGFFKGLTDKLK